MDESNPDKMPENITKENAVPLSHRGYAVAVEWKGNPFEGPQYWAQVQLLYQGKPVRLFSVPITRSFLKPGALEGTPDSN